MSTYFAPAGRVTNVELSQLVQSAAHDTIVNIILDSVDGFVLIINESRQIISATPELLNTLDLKPGMILGMRPGEAFGCENVSDGPDGCGTSPFCAHCGAVIAILAAQKSITPVNGECCLTTRKNDTLARNDYQLRITPIRQKNYTLYACVMHNITSHKRRDLLERVFLHDIKNTLSGLMGFGEILHADSPNKFSENIVLFSQQLRDEILNQQLLIDAERNRLHVEYQEIELNNFFKRIEGYFVNHPISQNKHFSVQLHSHDVKFSSDIQLLNRIIVNMLLNAFEASSPNETIALWADVTNKAITFNVKNNSLIPDEYQKIIFHHPFSTKEGMMRGIGTWSMRLLGEQYLKGTVHFKSNIHDKTIFSFTLPLTGPAS